MALAACGGGENEAEPRTDTRPTIESAVAEGLASRSDKLADLFESGDACGAKDEAARLRAELTEAINDRAIPELYLEDLSGVVNELEAQIPPCEVAAPPPRETDDEEKEKKGRHDEDDGGVRDEGDD